MGAANASVVEKNAPCQTNAIAEKQNRPTASQRPIADTQLAKKFGFMEYNLLRFIPSFLLQRAIAQIVPQAEVTFDERSIDISRVVRLTSFASHRPVLRPEATGLDVCGARTGTPGCWPSDRSHGHAARAPDGSVGPSSPA